MIQAIYEENDGDVEIETEESNGRTIEENAQAISMLALVSTKAPKTMRYMEVYITNQ